MPSDGPSGAERAGRAHRRDSHRTAAGTYATALRSSITDDTLRELLELNGVGTRDVAPRCRSLRRLGPVRRPPADRLGGFAPPWNLANAGRPATGAPAARSGPPFVLGGPRSSAEKPTLAASELARSRPRRATRKATPSVEQSSQDQSLDATPEAARPANRWPGSFDDGRAARSLDRHRDGVLTNSFLLLLGGSSLAGTGDRGIANGVQRGDEARRVPACRRAGAASACGSRALRLGSAQK